MKELQGVADGLHAAADGFAPILRDRSRKQRLVVAERDVAIADRDSALRVYRETDLRLREAQAAHGELQARGEAEKAGCTLPAEPGSQYRDIPGFCKSADLATIKEHGFVLTPGRYVGAANVEDDDTPFVERFAALQSRLETQFLESDRLTTLIRDKLAKVQPG